MKSHVGALDDSLTRAVVWGAAWDMTQDAHLAPEKFVSMVLTGITGESNANAISQLPIFAREAIDLYAGPTARASLRATWEAGLVLLLDSASPGSQLQIGVVKALAACAHSPEALRLLGDVLEERSTPPGLLVGPTLRWAILTGLARNDLADEQLIEFELERDPSLLARARVEGVRAARPGSRNKSLAWDKAVSQDDSIDIRRHILTNFQQFGQEAELQPFVDDFLTAATGLWEEAGPQHAITVLRFGFPLISSDESPLERVEEWLSTSPARQTARRYVREAEAHIARIVRVRAADDARSRRWLLNAEEGSAPQP